MKINKKVLIPVFATAMGLSVIGGISGAVAWYQYNSLVSSSFIGASVGDTGVLQISSTGAANSWKREYAYETASGDPAELAPVTFDQGNERFVMDPEAGSAPGYNIEPDSSRTPSWHLATNGVHYHEFDLYFNAYQVNNSVSSASDQYEYVERDVYLAQALIKVLNPTTNAEISDAKIKDAVRIKLDIYEDGTNLSKSLFLAPGNAATVTTSTYDQLDLDGDGSLDTYISTDPIPSGSDVGDDIYYGDPDHTSYNAQGIENFLVERESDGSIATDNDKLLFTTTGLNNAFSKVHVAIYLEGWALLGSASTADWNPFDAANCLIQVGLQFDSGAFRADDLN